MFNQQEEFDIALDDCLTLLQSGVSVDDCLEKYPHLSTDLEPILLVSAKVMRVQKPKASAGSVSNNRARMLAELQSNQKAEPFKLVNIFPKVSFKQLGRYAGQLNQISIFKEKTQIMKFAQTLATFAVLAIGLTATVTASASTIPGDALYPVKLMTEKAQVLVTADSNIADVQAKHTLRRLEEIKALQAENKTENVTITGSISIVDDTTILANGVEIDLAEFGTAAPHVSQASAVEVRIESGVVSALEFESNFETILVENQSNAETGIATGSTPAGDDVNGSDAIATTETEAQDAAVEFEITSKFTGITALGGYTYGPENFDLMQDIGMSWQSHQIIWTGDNSLTTVENLIEAAHSSGFKILLSISGSEYPSNIDFEGYVQFLNEIASLPDPPDAIEIWKEMNIDFSWPAGQVDPQVFVDAVLEPAYGAIKQANPSITVISGAPAPTGFFGGGCSGQGCDDDAYLRGMAAAGAAEHLDCIGAHYNAGATSPFATTGHPAEGSVPHHSWHFTTMVETYSSIFNDEVPLCFTEIGYLSADGFPKMPDRFSWASGTTAADQAQWLAEAYSISKDDPRVEMLMIFNIDSTYFDVNGDPQAGFAIIRLDGSCPACDLLKAVSGQ